MKRPRVIIKNSNPFQPHSLSDGQEPWKITLGYAIIIIATLLATYLLYFW